MTVSFAKDLSSSKCQELRAAIDRERAHVDEVEAEHGRAVQALAAIDVAIAERMQAAAVSSPALRRALQRELGREAAVLLVEDLVAELAEVLQKDDRGRPVFPRVDARRKIYDAQLLVEDQAWLARGKAAVLELVGRARHRIPPGADGFADFVRYVETDLLEELQTIAAIERWWGGENGVGGATGYLRHGVGTYRRRPEMLPPVWRLATAASAAEWILEVARISGLNGYPGSEAP